MRQINAFLGATLGVVCLARPGFAQVGVQESASVGIDATATQAAATVETTATDSAEPVEGDVGAEAESPADPADPAEPEPVGATDSKPTVESPAPAVVPAAAPAFKIESADGSSLKLGVLLQPQLQVVGDVTRDGYALNAYIRRTRILLGGSLFGVVDYFVDTDYANLFLANNVAGDPAAGTPDTSVKATPGMNIQDAFITLKPVGDAFKIDVGYMLPPLAHNALQGAGTLLSWDYFANSFLHSAAFGASANPIGRDAGLQFRGLVADNRIEYRLGMFQGLREGQTVDAVGSQNMFRVAGRVQANIFDPESGFFYAGTYLGAKKVLSVGGAFDIQDSYKYFAGDVLADMPVGPGVVTAQVNVAHWDGGTFIALQRMTAIMAEAGYHISSLHFSPIVRFEQLMTAADGGDETRWSLGVGYFPYGHNLNLKAFFTQRTLEGADHAANAVNLQAQVYVF